MKHYHPQHIVYIITKLELGGAQKVCLSLFKGLSQKNSSAHLISGSQGILTDEMASHPNTIFLNDLTNTFKLKHFFKELRCFIKLIRTLKTIKKQYPNLIVHTHSTKAGIMGRWAAFFAGISKRVHTIHGYGFHEYQKKYIWYAVYAIELATSFITTHFICVSSYDTQKGIKLLPCFSYKHSIIRAAIDNKQFYRPARKACHFPQKNQPFVFGTTACFKPQKNIFHLLQAFEKTFHSNQAIRLEIIGDGAQRPHIEQWIKTHNLQEVITLHGWQKEVAPIMLSWHAFVLTSLWEGLPCAIVEARMLKIPVLCYNTGGISDIITHGANGLLYQKGSWQNLAYDMLNITQNAMRYQRLQYHNDNLIDFHNEQMILQHRLLYKNIS